MRMFRAPIARQPTHPKTSATNNNKVHYANVSSRHISSKSPVEKPSKSQQAIFNVKSLYEKGYYKEALKEIDKIETEFPSCSKAAKHLRGKVSIALLDDMPPSSQSGSFKNLYK